MGFMVDDSQKPVNPSYRCLKGVILGFVGFVDYRYIQR